MRLTLDQPKFSDKVSGLVPLPTDARVTFDPEHATEVGENARFPHQLVHLLRKGGGVRTPDVLV